jgi:ribosomal protein S18 acetylase RimI-like enzyme
MMYLFRRKVPTSMISMEVRLFDLEEKYRVDLEELLFQLSGKKRTLDLSNHPNALNIGAFDGDRLIGFAQLFVLPKTTFIMGHLEDVIVHSDYRGHGLGRKLMEVVISQAKEKECSVINLTTRPERAAAVDLYKSLGFTDPGNNVMRLNLRSIGS